MKKGKKSHKNHKDKKKSHKRCKNKKHRMKLRSRLESFIRTKIMKRKIVRRSRSWKPILLLLNGLWTYTFPVTGKGDKIYWNTEIISSDWKPGLEASQGPARGTSAVECYWTSLPVHISTIKLNSYTRTRTVALHLTNKKRNKNKKIENGNIIRELKILHWNAGSRHLKNKTHELQHLIDSRKPDVFLVSEANVFSSDQAHEIVIPGFNMIRTKAWSTLGHCRLVALVRNGLQMEIVDNWMDEHISSIWFRVASRGIKTLHIGAIYRVHSILDQPEVTDSEQQQTNRWRLFIEQWQKAGRQADCIVVGDTNLDHLKWACPDQINVQMSNLCEKCD